MGRAVRETATHTVHMYIRIERRATTYKRELHGGKRPKRGGNANGKSKERAEG